MSYSRNIYNLNGRSIFSLHKILGPFFCNSKTHRESASLHSHQRPCLSVFQAGLPDDARVLHRRDVLSPDCPCCGGMELIASHLLKTKGNPTIPNISQETSPQCLCGRQGAHHTTHWNRAWFITMPFRKMMGSHSVLSLQTKHEKYKLTHQDTLQKKIYISKPFLAVLYEMAQAYPGICAFPPSILLRINTGFLYIPPILK